MLLHILPAKDANIQQSGLQACFKEYIQSQRLPGTSEVSKRKRMSFQSRPHPANMPHSDKTLLPPTSDYEAPKSPRKLNQGRVKGHVCRGFQEEARCCCGGRPYPHRVAAAEAKSNLAELGNNTQASVNGLISSQSSIISMLDTVKVEQGSSKEALSSVCSSLEGVKAEQGSSKEALASVVESQSSMISTLGAVILGVSSFQSSTISIFEGLKSEQCASTRVVRILAELQSSTISMLDGMISEQYASKEVIGSLADLLDGMRLEQASKKDIAASKEVLDRLTSSQSSIITKLISMRMEQASKKKMSPVFSTLKAP